MSGGAAGWPVDAAALDRTVDIVGRLHERRDRGGEAERRLIDIILADPYSAANAPIAEIARNAEVSEPTITRLARAMGFSGTRELRFHLTQALAIGGAYLRAPAASASEETGPAASIAAVISGAHAALDLFALGLLPEELDRIATALGKARRILVCGTGGGSSMAAVELQNRLFRLGLQVTTQTDPQLQRMSASVLGEDDAVIGFSISGQARSVSDALKIAGQYGATTVAVTRPDTPLAQVAQNSLRLTFQEGTDLFRPSAARFALLAAVDAIAMQTANAIGPPAIERLRRVRQSLATQDIRDPHLPIGD
ncbi:RpiR family transcriptional regulator [Palleronia aestuarii]|uniref:RpiR family transcriptional regulator n=1 Tax=Palleronia aestuarii TaxID=568105 RepID=A0A2W7PVT2_9RHOB|nr:MurR/RpiR family transcriptional regulator [Palleronia aestuarii]PZX13669.1 RpiR family transcriptional regulator [Palleronia aestuarii]